MVNSTFPPEGGLYRTDENQTAIATLTGLMQAEVDGTLLEARVVRCDAEHNLYVRLPCGEGIIPRVEGALGIAEGETKDIALITRVNRPVCFVVTGFTHTQHGCQPVLSRRLAQERCRTQYVDRLRCGDVIPARITRLESFGAFCDIGCGLSALLPIADISVSRITHPRDRFREGQTILTVVSSVENGRVCLSHRELLGTWEENAARFSEGETVAGIIRSIEPYGVFVEIAPNLSGLADLREGVRVGQQAAVYIKSLQPDKLKVKLCIISVQDEPLERGDPYYFIEEGPIIYWRYSPLTCDRVIESRFDRDAEEDCVG